MSSSTSSTAFADARDPRCFSCTRCCSRSQPGSSGAAGFGPRLKNGVAEEALRGDAHSSARGSCGHSCGTTLRAWAFDPPLEPSSKKPATSTWRELQTWRLTLRRIELTLETLGTDAGLAIICGPVSGVIAVDFDDAAGAQWGIQHLPPTPWRTKTLRGEHWFFRMPSTWTPPASTLPWKGELRAAGHYVVAPGSQYPNGGRYEALGAWSASKSELPEWDVRWLDVVDVEQQRMQRAAILKT